ncbi:hypothetical protein ABIE13_004546 [Ottowia thiooxydans]|uniref:Uncharacterized protein n=1 Tax=Ottowia thiooxydans TaxID=219182 RepID=A0ABV2QFS6_9BURK
MHPGPSRMKKTYTKCNFRQNLNQKARRPDLKSSRRALGGATKASMTTGSALESLMFPESGRRQCIAFKGLTQVSCPDVSATSGRPLRLGLPESIGQLHCNPAQGLKSNESINAPTLAIDAVNALEYVLKQPSDTPFSFFISFLDSSLCFLYLTEYLERF